MPSAGFEQAVDRIAFHQTKVVDGFDGDLGQDRHADIDFRQHAVGDPPQAQNAARYLVLNGGVGYGMTG